MERDTSTVVDTDADRVDGHTFESGYDLHDVAEAHLTERLEQEGFTVEQWGINRRHDKHVLGDDKMDLKVKQDGDLAALIEVKSKRSEDWFGVINRHHLIHYVVQSHDHDVPTLIYMCRSDGGDECIVDDTFIPVGSWGEYQRVRNDEFVYYPAEESERFLTEQIDEHPLVDRTWRAPDGNQVVTLSLTTAIEWQTFLGGIDT